MRLTPHSCYILMPLWSLAQTCWFYSYNHTSNSSNLMRKYGGLETNFSLRKDVLFHQSDNTKHLLNNVAKTEKPAKY